MQHSIRWQGTKFRGALRELDVVPNPAAGSQCGQQHERTDSVRLLKLHYQISHNDLGFLPPSFYRLVSDSAALHEFIVEISRVCLRLYQLSNVPRETLEERLGYDIPPLPQLSVAGITSGSVFLYWLNAKDPAFAGTHMSILVNGVNCKLHRDVVAARHLDLLTMIPKWAA